jgi:hypothetical protein
LEKLIHHFSFSFGFGGIYAQPTRKNLLDNYASNFNLLHYPGINYRANLFSKKGIGNFTPKQPWGAGFNPLKSNFINKSDCSTKSASMYHQEAALFFPNYSCYN